MGRIYTVPLNNVSVGVVMDVIAVYAGAVKAFTVHEVDLGQTGQTTVGNLRIRLRVLPATVTAGTGGAVGTVNRKNLNDTAAVVTSRTNDTTQATTSGTAVDEPDVWNPINGYQKLYPPEDRPVVGPNAAFILSLDQAPGAAFTCNGVITVEELF
jgi:hypothetical protein